MTEPNVGRFSVVELPKISIESLRTLRALLDSLALSFMSTRESREDEANVEPTTTAADRPSHRGREGRLDAKADTGSAGRGKTSAKTATGRVRRVGRGGEADQ